MKRFIQLALLPAALVAAILLTTAPSANAGGFSLQIGGSPFYGGGFGFPSRSNYGGGYQSYRGYNSYRPSYGFGGYGHAGHGHTGYGSHYGHRPSYGHPPYPHLDYHPPAIVPHGNHYDVLPGHYDYHHGRH